MATDGRHIFYNRAWTETLTREECTAVLAHEVCHIALLHHLRRGTRNPFLFNIACDYAINPILLNAGFKLPGECLFDAAYADMPAERIYDLLIDDIRSGKSTVVYIDGTSDGSGKRRINQQSWGDIADMPGAEDSSVRQAAEAETRVRVLQAANAAKSRGKLPAAFEGMIDRYRKSVIDWREPTRAFIGGNRPDNWSYRRPNKKHMALSSVYLPTVEYTGAGTIVIGVDSSGSVSNHELSQFLGEIKAIHTETRPDILYILWCDTKIHHIGIYTADDEFDDKKRYACGGTALRPIFDWIEENHVMPDSVIILTDMEIGDDCNDLHPVYPVLWISTGRDSGQPFGDIVKIIIKDNGQ